MKVRKQSVLAEVAACIFVARGAVFDLAHRVEPDKRGLLAISPQAERFLCGADCPRFAAVLVNNDFGLLAGGTETVADEIDFSFHYGKVVLRPALQHET